MFAALCAFLVGVAVVTRRATFAGTPAEDAKRPAATTAWRNLVLADGSLHALRRRRFPHLDFSDGHEGRFDLLIRA
jgi:hypothetical protein